MFISHPYVTEKEWNAYKGIEGEGLHLPKMGISATEADKYCKHNNGRLPTDAELKGQFCPIWEWTSNKEGKLRIMRGGSWNLNPQYVRVSLRYWIEPTLRIDFIGFRCIKEE